MNNISFGLNDRHSSLAKYYAEKKKKIIKIFNRSANDNSNESFEIKYANSFPYISDPPTLVSVHPWITASVARLQAKSVSNECSTIHKTKQNKDSPVCKLKHQY